MSGSGSSRNHCREARTRAEEPERVCTRAPPKRVGRAFALLTQTYHGGRQTGSNPESHRLSGQVLINEITGEVGTTLRVKPSVFWAKLTAWDSWGTSPLQSWSLGHSSVQSWCGGEGTARGPDEFRDLDRHR